MYLSNGCPRVRGHVSRNKKDKYDVKLGIEVDKKI